MLIKADNAQPAQISRQAGAVLAAGGLVVFPTETVYGVAAAAGSATGVSALRALKQRPHQPLTVHLPDPEASERYVDTSPVRLRRLMGRLMPGAVTLVVDVDDDVIRRKIELLPVDAQLARQLYYRNTIGLRCPDHEVGRCVLGAIDGPVIATSANRHLASPAVDAEEAARQLGDQVQLIVDGGRSRFGKASTIIRVRSAHGPLTVTVERAGVYDDRYIQKLLGWNMLLVCSGNTCRSAMAESLAMSLLAQRRRVQPDELAEAGITVTSAGTSARAGMAASSHAIEIMHEAGIDLSAHRSATLDGADDPPGRCHLLHV